MRPRALVLSESDPRRAELRHGLRAAGYDVWECRGAARAFDALRSEGGFSVAVLDGDVEAAVALARALRAERAFDALRLLILTRELRVDELLAAMDAGVDDYLPWPFSPRTLVEKLLGMGLRAAT